MIDDLTKKLLDDSRAILEGKKLDPVGKRDADVDNDGDVDSSDEYLGKRRDAIAKAMKKEGNKFSAALMAAKKNGDKEFEVDGNKFSVKEVEELEKDKNKEDIKEKEKEEDEEEVEESVFFDIAEVKLSPHNKKFIDMMNDMMKFKHGSKEFKAKKKEIEMFLHKTQGK